MSDEKHSETQETTLPSSTDVPDDQTLSPELLEIEHVYSALDHPRRRYLCYTLLENTEWSLTDLSTKIAAWENDAPEHTISTDQREQVYAALYHAHVPKLVDNGVITFDEVSETITAAEHADQVLSALEGIGASLDMDQEAHARSEKNDPET